MIEKVYFANLVQLLHERGVRASTRMYGGVASIAAGAVHIEEHGNEAFEAIVGPGVWRSDDLSVGYLAELEIGADDDCMTVPIRCSMLPIKSAADVADLIVAQTRLPYGQVLTPADAELVLQGQPVPARPTAAVVCHPLCHCRQAERSKD